MVVPVYVFSSSCRCAVSLKAEVHVDYRGNVMVQA